MGRRALIAMIELGMDQNHHDKTERSQQRLYLFLCRIIATNNRDSIDYPNQERLSVFGNRKNC
jgi:hypothetical protein